MGTITSFSSLAGLLPGLAVHSLVSLQGVPPPLRGALYLSLLDFMRLSSDRSSSVSRLPGNWKSDS